MKFTHKVKSIIAFRKGFMEELGINVGLLTSKNFLEALEDSTDYRITNFIMAVNVAIAEQNTSIRAFRLNELSRQFHDGMLTQDEYVNKVRDVVR